MCTILIVVCTLVGVLVPDLPDFSDPLLVRHFCFSLNTTGIMKAFIHLLGLYFDSFDKETKMKD